MTCLIALENLLTSSKVKPNQGGWESILTRWKSLQSRKPYWFLISDCVSKLLCCPAQEWQPSTATQIWCSSHLIACEWDAVVLLPQSHSRCSPAGSATLVRIMLPRIGFSVPKHSWYSSEGGGMGGWVNGAARVGQPVVNACKISNIGINFSYCLVWNDGLDFCGFCGLMEETCGDCRELFITTWSFSLLELKHKLLTTTHAWSTEEG